VTRELHGVPGREVVPSAGEDRIYFAGLGFATYEPSFDSLTAYVEGSPTLAAMNVHGVCLGDPAVSALVAWGRRLGIILALLERVGERIALALA
jgi:hypothetical protein